MRTVRIRSLVLALSVVVVGLPNAAPICAELITVPDSASAVRPLLVGSAAPSVTVRKPDGSSFDLKAAIQSKPTILVFYRGGW